LLKKWEDGKGSNTKGLGAVERTILLLLGLCTHLKPEMNPMKIIGPYLETFVLGKDRNWKKYLGTIIKEMAVSVFKIPEELNRLLSKTNQGENFVFPKKKIFDDSIK